LDRDNLGLISADKIWTIRKAEENKFFRTKKTYYGQWLRRFFPGDSPQRPGLDPRSIRVTFVLPVPKLSTNTAYSSISHLNSFIHSKGKGLPQQAEVAQGVPGRLRSRIFLTFCTTRVVGRQSYAPAAFTPDEIPGTHF